MTIFLLIEKIPVDGMKKYIYKLSLCNSTLEAIKTVGYFTNKKTYNNLLNYYKKLNYKILDYTQISLG